MEAQELKLEYERETDVMYVDLCPPGSDAQIDVFEVGENIGFPGQVLVRIDRSNQKLLGVTIQRYSSFKRKLLWKYRMISVVWALNLLVGSLRAALAIGDKEHNGRVLFT
jgi:uncharacterized protein YuzE